MTTRVLVLSLALFVLLASGASAVVGGKKADPADYPFFAVVGGGCGGALIAPDRVLTAAHCRDELVGKRFVWVGSERERRRVRRLAIHPTNVAYPNRSDADVKPADYMILELDRPVTDIAPLPIASSAPASGTAAVTVGQGSTGPDRDDYGTLRYGAVQVEGDGSCRELDNASLRTWFTCVRDPRSFDKKSRGPWVSGCFGDSGSPLLVRTGLGWETVGVDSWGPACGTERDPEVYADAVAGRDFALAASPRWAPAPVASPQVTGAARVGRTVTCAVRFLGTPRRVRYEFQLDGDVSARRKSATYRVRSRDAGGRLRCVVIAEGKGGTDVSLSPAVRVAR